MFNLRPWATIDATFHYLHEKTVSSHSAALCVSKKIEQFEFEKL